MTGGPVVWCVRHGQSVSNAGQPTVSPGLSGLTDLGRAQAAAVAARFDHAPDVIVHSSFVRTEQTARPTMDRFPDVPVEVWPVQEFTYLDSGHYSGTTSTERRPLVDAYWERCEPDASDGDGESFVQAMERSNLFIERLRGQEGFSVVFGHGKFLRMVAWMLLTGYVQPTCAAMKSFGHFRLGAYMPNAAVMAIQPGSIMFLSGFDVAHLPEDMRT